LTTLVTVVHILACVFLVLVILLQAGKGGGMGAAFGGAGSQTFFGGRGAQTFLGKLTAGAAAVFMATSLALSYQASHTGSVVDDHVALPAPSSVPPAGQGGSPLAPIPAQPEAPASVPAPAAPAPAPAPAK
jgi:preprotein translocase subunit SecG